MKGDLINMVDNYEEEAKELVRKMNEQFNRFNPKTEEIIKRQNPEQGLLKDTGVSTEKINPNILKSGPPPTPIPTPGACSQCGMLHPPLKPGEKCPNAKVELKSEKYGKEVSISKYLTDLRNVIVSHISIKKIKDPDKLFQNITIEITKYLEGYSE